MSRRQWSIRNVAAVSVAYYIGARIGFALQSPVAPQSVLWLPNSILLAVLLLAPPRTWPAYLLGAFPAQMLVCWQTHAPPGTMALLFVTNCADAALAAFLVRRVAGTVGSFHFDSLRSTVAFAIGASVSVVLLSFADAEISTVTHWSSSYSAAFMTRVRSNILTHLIVVPALVEVLTAGWRRVRTGRVVEATVLAALLIAACAAAFSRSSGSHVFPAVLYIPIPVLLWAAFRFGPGGTGWSALAVAVVASRYALHGRGPFTSSSPVEDVLALQLFLLASAAPLLFLSAVIRERDRATRALRANEAALRRSYDRARHLAGRLLVAQEEERARIARDMHDDFNQQLASLTLSISELRRRRESNPGALLDALHGLQDQAVQLSDRVRQFSHDLHPGMLDHVGLVPAVRRLCAEVGGQHQMELTLAAADDVVGPLPRDTAICAYRVVQEALRNVVRHAGVRGATVSLRQANGCLELEVVDAGRGFDESTGAAEPGMGLLSMRERVNMVGGALTVSSGVGRGTTLRAYIPINPA